jgi:Integrase core domain
MDSLHPERTTSVKRWNDRGSLRNERFHRTVLDEFYRVAFRKKIYRTIDELQADLDTWIAEYNRQRPHQGRWCFGKTPMDTFLDALPLAKEKLMAA